MRQVSGSKSALVDELFYDRVEAIELVTEWSGNAIGVKGVSQALAEKAGVGAAEEHGDPQAKGGNAVAVGVRDALDEAVQSQMP